MSEPGNYGLPTRNVRGTRVPLNLPGSRFSLSMASCPGTFLETPSAPTLPLLGGRCLEFNSDHTSEALTVKDLQNLAPQLKIKGLGVLVPIEPQVTISSPDELRDIFLKRGFVLAERPCYGAPQ